ncbi:hypothetical protein A2617_01505 [Candidatus Daviesbacteria bacterium RIFOXYD1_FULL_41_10]|uniref:Uncharacterized protein n=2 Tax=Candidatus Daviesiibacteriota TaxID=1752718 RepID=A0A1F5MZK6_9BACT|nr:MAG: hypothetical protein UU67_C0022G0002 [Candidatus Daviesbacteria bacterium GW2011_GWB1_41_5]OGE70743.1 MAG: hypothetical protein A2617_01505 [Candidatus Daviesbacteria bacterium RIFOXYD1_FULL_41_10]HBR20183.1 hypothetical protein [Phycisphaerales bacterium]
MNAQDLTLNIAVNLNRLSKFALEKRQKRVNQFLEDTDYYVNQLENAPKSDRFNPTFQAFRNKFYQLKKDVILDEYWAEDMLTWANILTHRAKLA